LIAVPSVNPAFLPPGNKYAGEATIEQWLADRAAKEGFDVQRQEVQPNRSNLLVYLRPSAATRQRVVLAPHLDTVGGDELPGEFFTPRRKNGRIYGLGACDTKGSIAIMFTAMCELARSTDRPRETEIVFAGLVDEEYGQAGARALVKARFKADLAIVGEPTLLKVVTAHKGVLWLRLTTRGKAAHGARPELGRNAVHEMVRIVEAIESDYAKELRRFRHPLLGRATVNVGSIRGGRQPNIVPDKCAITVDRRTLPGETDARALQQMRAIFRRKRLHAKFERFHPWSCSALETDPALPLVRRFMEVTRQKAPASVNFFSDGGVLSSGGIPAVLFGPGDIAHAHRPDEWIREEQLERGTALLLRFLQSLP
jgi:acetylornithine deacetylase/succinyl-diaminopimelate desuccinylase-like protein